MDSAPATLQMPTALPRSAGSGKIWESRASEVGVSSAAPTPCAARAAISVPPLVASPAPSEARVKMIRPVTNTRLAPYRSASLPPTSISPANTRM